jgi:hypothetical protein
MAQLDDIWAALLARGYSRRDGDQGVVEVLQLGGDEAAIFQVRFAAPGAAVPELHGTYAHILARIAHLPIRREP